MRNKEIIERLLQINPKAILADGLDDAIIGYTQNNEIVAVYDVEKCLCILEKSGMPTKEAVDYLENSIFINYKGKNNPIFVSL